MSRNGGLPARRAVVRWAWRMFRREWRQQVMVLTLLTVAVAVATVGVSAGYHVTPPGAWVEAAAGVFGVYAVAMLLVCLIASAGFAVLAHRRLRQLGLLAAVGASPQHLRLVLLAHGAAAGVTASTTGAVAGALMWIAVTPRFETVVGRPVNRLDLPWWQIAAVVLLAVLTATAAAWRPARAAARVPIVRALSARPPRPKRARRSAVAAGVLVTVGVVSLRIALARRSGDDLGVTEAALIVAGALAIGLALLFVAPSAVRVLAAAGTRLPVAPRLAWRDLGRHQARSSAALAAISLALAVPAAIVIVANVLEHGAAGDNRGGLAALRAIATVGGAVLALAILAMTVGLIRAEAAGDLRVLTATGAAGGIRRSLTSATAGGLALLGAVLGIGTAYTLILAGSSRSQLSELARVPVVDLLVIAVGVPLLAAALGWLLAGREPRSLTRPLVE
ncbi:MAG: FtsX-like permease family protein [Actinomycetota bacterium]|nr:FtsX-like permease family protein [Actinomycetota bacterium]